MLEVADIKVAYGQAQVLHGISLNVKPGQILCILGRNGAGKTTTMKAIMGLLRISSGAVLLDGEDIGALPAHEVPRLGIGYIPQGRRLFAELTVAENLEIGLMVRGLGTPTRDRVLDIFPRLRERIGQRADTLSGGEQQMLATARALCLEPQVLLLDEPTEGLQPSMIEQIRQVIVAMKAQGVAIILVEQRVDAVLSIADRVAFIENGRNRDTVEARVLIDDHELLTRYIGV
ncbi:Branched-chain amino acid transport ATP-binding protein LivF (TC 3.A.1.4.1) [hydrothermal vent metagenome]|uniref:Branched-chain amino acid transport ATP-binding protein LivF (TC 3.A.1.4.1) n=1 Tax=hydrothermal vent metagenome TaxID=652676 RepID=A0A3B0TI05_9ZZZZ